MKTISEKDFDAIIGSEKILIAFSAIWCNPCVRLGTTLLEIEKELNEKIKVFKVDVDKCPNIIRKFNIRSVPTLMFFHNGEPKETILGFKSSVEIKNIIGKYL